MVVFLKVGEKEEEVLLVGESSKDGLIISQDIRDELEEHVLTLIEALSDAPDIPITIPTAMYVAVVNASGSVKIQERKRSTYRENIPLSNAPECLCLFSYSLKYRSRQEIVSMVFEGVAHYWKRTAERALRELLIRL